MPLVLICGAIADKYNRKEMFLTQGSAQINTDLKLITIIVFELF
jgi:hypothetical protein